MTRPETVSLAYRSWVVMALATCAGFVLLAVAAAVGPSPVADLSDVRIPEGMDPGEFARVARWMNVGFNAVFALLFGCLILFFARSVYYRFAHPDRSRRTLWLLTVLVLYDALLVSVSSAQMEVDLWLMLAVGWVHICAAVAGVIALWFSTRNDATAWVKGEKAHDPAH